MLTLKESCGSQPIRSWNCGGDRVVSIRINKHNQFIAEVCEAGQKKYLLNRKATMAEVNSLHLDSMEKINIYFSHVSPHLVPIPRTGDYRVYFFRKGLGGMHQDEGGGEADGKALVVKPAGQLAPTDESKRNAAMLQLGRVAEALPNDGGKKVAQATHVKNLANALVVSEHNDSNQIQTSGAAAAGFIAEVQSHTNVITKRNDANLKSYGTRVDEDITSLQSALTDARGAQAKGLQEVVGIDLKAIDANDPLAAALRKNETTNALVRKNFASNANVVLGAADVASQNLSKYNQDVQAAAASDKQAYAQIAGRLETDMNLYSQYIETRSKEVSAMTDLNEKFAQASIRVAAGEAQQQADAAKLKIEVDEKKEQAAKTKQENADAALARKRKLLEDEYQSAKREYDKALEDARKELKGYSYKITTIEPVKNYKDFTVSPGSVTYKGTKYWFYEGKKV